MQVSHPRSCKCSSGLPGLETIQKPFRPATQILHANGPRNLTVTDLFAFVLYFHSTLCASLPSACTAKSSSCCSRIFSSRTWSHHALPNLPCPSCFINQKHISRKICILYIYIYDSPCGLQRGPSHWKLFLSGNFYPMLLTPEHHHTVSHEDTRQSAMTCKLSPNPLPPGTWRDNFLLVTFFSCPLTPLKNNFHVQ